MFDRNKLNTFLSSVINMVPNMMEEIARSQNVQGLEGLIKCFVFIVRAMGGGMRQRDR